MGSDCRRTSRRCRAFPRPKRARQRVGRRLHWEGPSLAGMCQGEACSSVSQPSKRPRRCKSSAGEVKLPVGREATPSRAHSPEVRRPFPALVLDAQRAVPKYVSKRQTRLDAERRGVPLLNGSEHACLNLLAGIVVDSGRRLGLVDGLVDFLDVDQGDNMRLSVRRQVADRLAEKLR